jgi:acetyl-CoA C-acetyltransferase
MRATHARASGYFDHSVVPVKDAIGQIILAQDEFIKPNSTLEGLASLKPSFEQMGSMGFDQVALTRYPQVERIHHVHHAGNSSGLVDGAAAVLIGSAAAAKAHGLTPRARIVSVALSGADPTIMLTGPMPAARKALAKAGMTIDQMDLIEVNEAFAAVVMRFMKEMGVSHDKVNVNGGAIAMGHPLGMSGARLVTTACYELERRAGRYALCTMCIGVGQGIALVIERI